MAIEYYIDKKLCVDCGACDKDKPKNYIDICPAGAIKRRKKYGKNTIIKTPNYQRRCQGCK